MSLKSDGTIRAPVVRLKNINSAMANSDIEVVVGIIWNKAGEVLLAKRRADVHCGGLWEFPGGKLEQNELLLTGLQRELHEEVGITVSQADYLFTLPWQYPSKPVKLHVHSISDYQGEPFGKEGQEVRWVPVADLAAYKFPSANAAIVETVRQHHALQH